MLDGNGAPVANGTPVTIAIAPGTRLPGTLHGDHDADHGRRAPPTFGDLSIDAPGSYALAAQAGGAGSATSEPFLITDAQTVCIERRHLRGVGVLAEHADPGHRGRATASAPSFLSLSLNVGSAFQCKGYNAVLARLGGRQRLGEPDCTS